MHNQGRVYRLSEGPRTIIPIIGPKQEIQEHREGVMSGQVEIKCKLVEDSSDALIIATFSSKDSTTTK